MLRITQEISGNRLDNLVVPRCGGSTTAGRRSGWIRSAPGRALLSVRRFRTAGVTPEEDTEILQNLERPRDVLVLVTAAN